MNHRFDPHIARVQFGLMGINAHINRDLMLAIIRASEQTTGKLPKRNSPEYRDYTRINDILDEVELRAMQKIA